MIADIIVITIIAAAIAGGLIGYRLGKWKILWQQKRAGHKGVEKKYQDDKEKYL